MADTPLAAGRGTGVKDTIRNEKNTKSLLLLWRRTPTLFAARRDPTSLYCPPCC